MVSVVCPLAVVCVVANSIRVSFAGDGIELVGDASRRVIDAVADGHHREYDQRADLNHVDGDAYCGRPRNTAMRNVSNPEGKHGCDHHHEQRAWIGGAHGVWPQGAHDVTAEDSRHGHHHTRIDPVVQVRRPADDKLGKPGVAPVLVMIQKRLFGEIIGTAGAGVELRKLCVAYRRCQTKRCGEKNADPHRRRRGPLPCLR